jgi:hypothetical protein
MLDYETKAEAVVTTAADPTPETPSVAEIEAVRVSVEALKSEVAALGPASR